MLFKEYSKAYITEDLRVIRTGKFSYSKTKGHYLENVTIEETQDEIRIHGYKRVYEYFCSLLGDRELSVEGLKNLDDFCTTEGNFWSETRKVSLFSKETKTNRYLNPGFYHKKQKEEKCFCFHKTDIIEEYTK